MLSRLAAAALALPLAACLATPVEYEALVLVDLGEKLGGCAVGDLSPDDGNEIAVVSASGRLVVVTDAAGAWRAVEAGRASGEMIQVAVGDLWPGVGADELVAVGMVSGDEDSGGDGAVFVAGWDPDERRWVARPVFTDSALVHAVAVADLDPDHPGDEALVGGFSQNLTLLRFVGDGAPLVEVVGTTPAPAKGMVPIPTGVAVACNDGSLVLVERGPTGWEVTVPFVAPAGLARLATDGTRILAAADDGGLWLIEGHDGQRLYSEGSKLRGAVLADVDPDWRGLEAVTAGYGGDVVLLRQPAEGPWERERLHRSRAALHHLARGDVDGGAPGQELVTVGYAGEVVLIRRRR